MTTYTSASRRKRRDLRIRPTLRMRLALVNGVVLGLVAVALVAVATLIAARNRLLVDAIGVFVIILAGTLIGTVVVGRALRPLQQVTATARRLSGETLDQRIGYTGVDDEVAELAATFDAMLDRLAESFEAQKRFVANASHELRTPLAVMRTEIDVTMSDPDADLAEYRRMATVVRDASERANALIGSLLVLAKSEAQAGRRLVRKVPADLRRGIEAALASVEREAGRLSLDIETDLQPAPVIGDPGLLDRLVGNLIENAVRYNHGQGQVWIRTWSDERFSRIVVANTGFEVAAADVPRLFEAFKRGVSDRTGSRGAGLGLSIVRAICDAHGGTLTPVARPDGGLEITVALPAAASTPLASGQCFDAPDLRAPADLGGLRSPSRPCGSKTQAGRSGDLGEQAKQARLGPWPEVSAQPTGTQGSDRTGQGMEDLRTAIRAGDHDAFATLFDRYAGAVYAHAVRVTGDRDAAEDVLSVVFLEAWRLRGRIRPEGDSLRPWLFGIATNVLRNTARASRRHRAALARIPPQVATPDFSDDLANAAADAAALAAARSALARLRRPERDVVLLVVWAGLDYAAAAEALGVPVGTVRSRLSRARTRLRAAVREPPTESGQVSIGRSSAARLIEEGRP